MREAREHGGLVAFDIDLDEGRRAELCDQPIERRRLDFDTAIPPDAGKVGIKGPRT